METYSLLREFADSWMLLFLFIFFMGIFAWVMRPSAKETYEETAGIPFRNDDKPSLDEEARK